MSSHKAYVADPAVRPAANFQAMPHPSKARTHSHVANTFGRHMFGLNPSYTVQRLVGAHRRDVWEAALSLARANVPFPETA